MKNCAFISLLLLWSRTDHLDSLTIPACRKCGATSTQLLCLSQGPSETLSFTKRSLAVGSIIFTLANGIPFGNIHEIAPAAIADSVEIKQINRKIGKLVVDGEISRIFLKARQCESDGDYKIAQQFYEQVVEAEPDFIYAWSNLGNVLTAEGNLRDAILCYKKALSLNPPSDTKAIILLNKASIEVTEGDNNAALRDIEIAERLRGPDQSILTNKAVAYSNLGRWDEACTIFEKVISSADRNALPWWLRYSMALLESSRGAEAVAYLQRTLNRYPSEPECIAFAAALYQTLDSPAEAASYWSRLSDEDKLQYSSEAFISNKLHWGSKATNGLLSFLKSSKSN